MCGYFHVCLINKNEIAVCIVGGLRTFAVPAVHESMLITAWNADTFFMFTIANILTHLFFRGLGTKKRVKDTRYYIINNLRILL